MRLRLNTFFRDPRVHQPLVLIAIVSKDAILLIHRMGAQGTSKMGVTSVMYSVCILYLALRQERCVAGEQDNGQSHRQERLKG